MNLLFILVLSHQWKEERGCSHRSINQSNNNLCCIYIKTRFIREMIQLQLKKKSQPRVIVVELLLLVLTNQSIIQWWDFLQQLFKMSSPRTQTRGSSSSTDKRSSSLIIAICNSIAAGLLFSRLSLLNVSNKIAFSLINELLWIFTKCN